MQVVIIEDEPLTAELLKESLAKIAPDARVMQMLATISDSVRFFKESEQPDLIFCDIHLADGQSFEIFKNAQMNAPVIFITAYDQYALQAFKANGIDYILKPFKDSDIAESINKYRALHRSAVKNVLNYEYLATEMIRNRVAEPTSLLVKYRDKIKPVKISDVAFFVTENKTLHMTTLSSNKYVVTKTLDDVEKICGNKFYRVNRQILVNREAIEEVIQGYSRKLIIRLKVNDAPDLILNKTKITEFLSWLSA
ncbi:MAG TPA: LytTR family DNA-binding domain-containing protein [Niabella sp.]